MIHSEGAGFDGGGITIWLFEDRAPRETGRGRTVARFRLVLNDRYWRAPWKGGAFQWVQVPPGDRFSGKNQADATEMFWRSISKDNITTWYGKTEQSRIFDPEDPSRIFSWLICESYDDKGNVISYGYKPEDSSNIDRSTPNERNRTDVTRRSNRYLKRVRYGNKNPYLPKLTVEDSWPRNGGGRRFGGLRAGDSGDRDNQINAT